MVLKSLIPLQFVAEGPLNKAENRSRSTTQNHGNVNNDRRPAGFHVASPTHIHSSARHWMTETGRYENSPSNPPQLLSSSGASDEHYEESAAQGLLALGHSTVENLAADSDTSISISQRLEDNSALRLELHLPSPPAIAADINPTVPSSCLDSLEDVKSDHILELIKYFRYEVAPWLDIYDMSHSFGILVPRMATESRELLFALLALSADSMASMTPSSSRLRGDAERYAGISESYRNTESTTNNLHRVVAAVLVAIYHYSLRLSEKLMNDINRAIGFLSSLPVNLWKSCLTAGIYGLLLRLDISNAISNNTALRTSLPANGHAPSATKASQFDAVFDQGQYILSLCAQAVHLRSRNLEMPPVIRSPGPESFIDRWRILAERLSDWYDNRPQDFRPMVDVSSTDISADIVHQFPTILFTNSAAVFTNQMFHTAMFLLLEHKPRTLRFIDNHNIVMSPLWNIHRICGIAVNNDRRECWDPLLVTSFFVAAKQMTHESQQNIIQQAFFRIKGLTGMDISEPLAKLHEIWKLADGT
ncbi:hypothetical protein ANI_1_3042024 [Paecilomyces variotii No. 5]|uniref:Zn(II)2Cys6 transcription factor n=1 Tax=Byssochlamys spectabilis (strain No. 5 / NBRC 109023) TaxID=1356009 RepID=V5G5Y2_BYSSN|nr:hypothetical protein ANI_1_3042024 [Paecilomyces variotii No. 5]